MNNSQELKDNTLSQTISRESTFTSIRTPSSLQQRQASFSKDYSNNSTLQSNPVTKVNTPTNTVYKSELFVTLKPTTSLPADISSRCDKCNRLIDTKNGSKITFNNRFYHDDCFTCAVCHKNLNNFSNDKFKINDNGEPICPQCQLAQAKICYACQEPILNQGLITFDTKTYHDDCFYCGQCQKSLVNEKNLTTHNSKPCCNQCYNKNFAPRCEQCLRPISTGKILTYNGKDYHSDCFQCSQCHQVITENEFKTHNSKPCCLKCYHENFAPQCTQCLRPISNKEITTYKGKNYHPDCFQCDQCHKVITEKEFANHNSKPCCLKCYDENFAPRCEQCSKPITKGKTTNFNDKKYHPDCFRCDKCNRIITDSTLHTHNLKPCCNQCYDEKLAPNCAQCLKKISVGRTILYDEKVYHPDCFLCFRCNNVITDTKFHTQDSKPCCARCHNEYFTLRCDKCSRTIVGKYTVRQGKNYHTYCSD